MRIARSLIPAMLAAALVACGGVEDGPVEVTVVGAQQDLRNTGLRLSLGAQLVRAATAQGLVTFDANGDVLPGLADSWIVTDDGQSYIFRLRDTQWEENERLDGRRAAAALEQAIAGLEGTSLGLDLAPVADVRAMAGRVIEVRLSSPMPNLLQVLAQPELALRRDRSGKGDMVAEETQDGSLLLTFRPPGARGLPQDEGWEADYRPLRLHAAAIDEALLAFAEGQTDVVTGGRLDTWPLANPGPLSRGTVRIDPAMGLFGMRVMRERGVLATPEGRDALSLALDRDALIAPFGIGGWMASARIVPADIYAGLTVLERWSAFSLEDRREQAQRRIAALAAGLGEDSPEITAFLPEGPGHDALFVELQTQWNALGLTLTRAPDASSADLVLVDRVARFAGPRWYLNQFNCSLGRGLCSPDADEFVAMAVAGEGELTRMQMLQQAEALMLRDAIYIPFGAPVRWSLVRGGLSGFAPNQWGFHPLPPMATLPK